MRNDSCGMWVAWMVGALLWVGPASADEGSAYPGTMTNACPTVTKLVVTPRKAALGEEISVAAAATDPDGDSITYQWTSSAGSFADPSAASTTYLCENQGTHTLSITVSDPEGCATTSTAEVACGQ